MASADRPAMSGTATSLGRIVKVAAVAAVVLMVLLLMACLWIRGQLGGSLPQLDGRSRAAGLADDVVVERDALGIPTIRAQNRLDLALATGFVHAQDRFFQMDLLRRNAAGELAEIVGPAVLDADRRIRVNRFRDVAQRVLADASDLDRAIVEAYARGVNAGLASLRVKPFEYLLLGEVPLPWKPEDCALVMFSMYLDLQGGDYADEARLGLMHDRLPQALFDFLAPRGTEWDAPIQGEAFEVAPFPSADVFDTRKVEQVARRRLAPLGLASDGDTFHAGSNSWAVAGEHTFDGRALLADDMHLGIRVPHIWYRASFVWPAPDGHGDKRVTGVSLPGTPAMIVGSNGHVAWGFTNSEGDWVDCVIVETDPSDPESYAAPDGRHQFAHHREVIKVKGAADEWLDVVSTIWGPVIDRDHKHRPRAIRWVAHDTAGVNMGLLRMESAQSLEQALELANSSGSPAQNFVVADDKGHIAWTILGRIPRRIGFDGRLPTSWADGACRWDGYLAPEEYPRIIDPPLGRVWTANARPVSGEMLAKLGDGGYDLGARASQIRDDLLATRQATEVDMLRIQLDDRALFLERWRRLLLDVLTPQAIEADPRRGELREFVDRWGGRAAVDSVGFRSVRSFRLKLVAQLSDVLVNACKAVEPKFSIAKLDRTEGPIWRLVSQRPAHLIDPRFETWEALLLAAADEVIAEARQAGPTLAGFTWGKHNTTKIQHPLSLAVPLLANWLDMPRQELPGDTDNMPRIQGPAVGASQRMTVSPGHEQDGTFHMPCGQSGHPLSPHYRDAHGAWAEGRQCPFLPGPPIHTLVLTAAGRPEATE